MRLRKLYANNPEVRPPIYFHDGLNVVIGEIRRRKSREDDTHNLGKTLLCQLLDFCLLRQKESEFFLFKKENEERFAGLIFFLEVESHSGERITIRRGVRDASKISFMRHSDEDSDFVDVADADWSHVNVAFSRARKILDGLLDLRSLQPWDYRDAIGYALRTQRDFSEPFQLAKHAGKHADWKPFLAHTLGLNGRKVAQVYELAEDLDSVRAEIDRLKAEVSGIAESADELRGLISIKSREVLRGEEKLEEYDFQIADAEIDRDLVGRLDQRIAELNEQRYYLRSDLGRIQSALDTRMSFDIKKIEKVFNEARVYFGDQLVKDYSALQKFNQEITVERNKYLRKELTAVEESLAKIEPEISTLNKERASALATLRDKETISKFKRLSKRLVKQKTELEVLRRRHDLLGVLAEKRALEARLSHERELLREEMEDHLKEENPIYKEVRENFDSIVYAVIAQHANLFTKLNAKGNIEFRVSIVDAEGKATSAGEGHTYGRLLCIAFDLAVVRAHLGQPWPHFVYHDGALETLDPRKKLNLIDVIREYSRLGIQHIVTLIDSELPHDAEGKRLDFDDDEIILRLHDEGEEGLLFRMEPW